jgi:hypothetical protein
MPSRFPVLRHVLVKMTLFRDSVTMPREGARRKAAIFDSIKSFVLDYYRCVWYEAQKRRSTRG